MQEPCRFNVVLPQAPGFNAGMAAVDLGLLAAAQALAFEPVPWRLGALADRAKFIAPDLDLQMEMGLGSSQTIRGQWPDGLDEPILYWGDFHHMATYVDRFRGVIGTPLGGRSAAHRYLLLQGVPSEVKRRSASFGTTLIFNTVRDFTEGPYAEAVEDFLSRNAMTVFRDPISTALVRRLRPDGAISTGVDPALLLEPGQIPEAQEPGGIGVFLGRSPTAHAGLWMVARRLAEEMGVRTEWIDWGDSRGFPFISVPSGVGFIDGASPSGETKPVSRAMSALIHLSSCVAVVTDSYHAALIAWRLGIPAVTVSEGSTQSDSLVNRGKKWSWRDKRELAASQYGVLDLVVRSEELVDDELLRERTDHILEFIQDDTPMRFIRSWIEDEARAALSILARLSR